MRNVSLYTIIILPVITNSFIPTGPFINSKSALKLGKRGVPILKSFSIDDVDLPSDTPDLLGSDSAPESSNPNNNPNNNFLNEDNIGDNIGDWKETLDELLSSLLSPQTPPELRVTLLKDLLSSDEEIRADVMKAIEGKDPEILLTSNAKALRDGTNAV